MTSNCCKNVVRMEFEKYNLNCKSIELGKIEIVENVHEFQLEEIRIALEKFGYEIIYNKQSILIESIKSVIVEQVYSLNPQLKTNFSTYLSNKLKLDYTYLANSFSDVLGITIEHFIILHKIEKVKQMIRLNDFNLTEISQLMYYSSVAHLSTQFKKITGVTPSQFKQYENQSLHELEKV
jgi:AraC-like DNA-binding protein